MAQQKGFKRAKKVEARHRKKVAQTKVANIRRLERQSELKAKEAAGAEEPKKKTK